MKKLLLSLATITLLLGAPRLSRGDVEVNFDFFYNNLAGGSWIEVADYGYCWQPDVVVSNHSWRPYADGYWAYTDLGWTWVSYEDFGWATYHYGRWVQITDYGWVWAPGRDSELEWGPAWVSWRTGGDYIGWAPLPPEVTITGRPIITGHIDADFDIGPACYNFVDVRYIGEPVLRERIVPVTQNVTYIQQTVNVTKITYTNNVVYNYGPDINAINSRAARPVQRLKFERQQNVDITRAAKAGALTKVQGDKLLVAAPMKVKKSAQVAPPPQLKAKVAQPKIDKGWSVVSDENTRAQLKQKFKAEDSSKIPPPTGAGGATQADVAASVSPGANVNAGAAASTQQGQGQGGRRGQRGAAGMAAASASPVTSPATSASPVQAGRENVAREGRGEGRRGNRFQQPTENTSAGGTSAAETVGGAAAIGSAAGIGGAQSDEQGQAEIRGHRGQRRGQEAQNQPPSSTGREAEGPNTASDQSQQGPGGGRHGGRGQLQNQPAQGAGAAQDTSDQNQVRRGSRRAQVPQGPQGQGGEGRGQGQGHQGGKRGQGQGEASPAPSPQ